MISKSEKIRIAVPYTKRLFDLPNVGFVTLLESLWSVVDKRYEILKLQESELLEKNDYDIVLSIRCVGTSEKCRKHLKKMNKPLVLWHDDLHHYKYRIPRPSKTLRRKFEEAEIIFLPYFYQFKKWDLYQQSEHKVVWLPWSVPNWTFDFSQSWDIRKNKVLLSGYCNKSYPLRKKLFAYVKQNGQNTYLDVLQHPGYQSNAKKSGITGKKYYELLGSYRGAVATTTSTRLPLGLRKIDYTVAKYMEIPACGCLSFMEKTPDLRELGFVDGEHYISINRWNYKKRFEVINSKDAQYIAKAGQELVKQKHTHDKRIKVILSEIKKRLM